MANSKLFRTLALGFYAFSLLFIAPPAPAYAQGVDMPSCGQDDPLGLDCVDHTGLKNTDPRIIVGRIIRVILGLLGALFLVMTIYAGFTWMTAGGNEENVTKAKKILTTSVIGLMIILMSYSITAFVMSRICESVSTNQPCTYF